MRTKERYEGKSQAWEIHAPKTPVHKCCGLINLHSIAVYKQKVLWYGDLDDQDLDPISSGGDHL